MRVGNTESGNTLKHQFYSQFNIVTVFCALKQLKKMKFLFPKSGKVTNRTRRFHFQDLLTFTPKQKVQHKEFSYNCQINPFFCTMAELFYVICLFIVISSMKINSSVKKTNVLLYTGSENLCFQNIKGYFIFYIQLKFPTMDHISNHGPYFYYIKRVRPAIKTSICHA